MNLEGSVALVTGANRGLGAVYAQMLLERGAAKIYAAVRDVGSVTDRRLTPIRLDVTDRPSIDEAADAAPDVGYTDTDMAAWFDGPKTAPEVVAAAALDAVEAGEHEVLVDDWTRQVRAGLSGPLSELYPALATPVGSL